MSPFDAQEKVLEIASSLGISITVAMVNEFGRTKAGITFSLLFLFSILLR